MIELPRRQFITGLISFAAVAPAIVRASSLMPVKAYSYLTLDDYLERILNPMLDRLHEQIANDIMNNNGYIGHLLNFTDDKIGIKPVFIK